MTAIHCMLFIEIAVFVAQLLHYCSRKQELKRRRFLVVIATFLVYDLIFISLQYRYPEVLGAQASVPFLFCTVLTYYYYHYLLHKLEIPTAKRVGLNIVLLLFIATLVIIFVLLYFLSGFIDLSRVNIFVAPALLTIYFFIFAIRISVLESRKTKNQPFDTLLSCLGLSGLALLMTASVIHVFWGMLPSAFYLINSGSLLLGISYLSAQWKQSKEEHRALMNYGYYARKSDLLSTLSDAEREIVMLRLQGLSNSEIASIRSTAGSTIRSQVSVAFRKLEVETKEELVEKIRYYENSRCNN